MNARIQVEHPVTEMITNTDLVSLQLLVAAGNPLPMKQKDIHISGHAIEVRLCAEDAENNFKPSAGQLSLWRFPEKEHLRVETFVKEGNFISPNYDSLVAKLVVWGETRTKAISQLQRVLTQTGISGIHTNLSFLSGLMDSEVIQKNRIYTRYVDENLDLINSQIQEKKQQLNKHKIVIAYLIFHRQQNKNSGNSIWNQIGFWRIFSSFDIVVNGEKYSGSVGNGVIEQIFIVGKEKYRITKIEINNSRVDLLIDNELNLFYVIDNETISEIQTVGFAFAVRSNMFLKQAVVNRNKFRSGKVFQNLICADLFGKVLKLNCCEGDVVQSGQILLTLESMKTEIHVLCPVDAHVKKIYVKEGNAIVEKQLLVELEEKSVQ